MWYNKPKGWLQKGQRSYGHEVWKCRTDLIEPWGPGSDYQKFGGTNHQGLSRQKAFDGGDFLSAKNQLNPLAKYLIPINIFLGIIVVILGITLRGF